MRGVRQCLGCMEPAREGRDFCSALCEHQYMRERELTTPREPVETAALEITNRPYDRSGTHRLNLQNSA